MAAERSRPALSLAQHYGLPTCLLDFTWNPYVAAYFAVVGYMGGHANEMQPLCVWIIDDANFLMRGFDINHSLEILVPPASDNRTLQAQDGLFMWQRLSRGNLGDPNAEYQETAGFEKILSDHGPQCRVIKLLLEMERPSFLLHKLIKLGYDGSRLFPGFGGAARAIKEHSWAHIGSAW
jgi:hypothetical protein